MSTAPSLFTGPTKSNDHRTYTMIATHEWFEKHRAWIDAAWARCAPFLDPGFAHRFRLEFHQRAWELRLAWTLLELGFRLARREQHGEGPDFEIPADSTSPRTWIEAVTASHGQGADRVLEPPTDGVYSSDKTGVMLRYAKAIQSKWADLRRYRERGIVKDADAYVIALNPGSMVRATLELREGPFLETPWIVRVLYGIGETFIRMPIGAESNEYEHGVHRQPTIAQRSGRLVDSRIFCDPRSSAITGILFGQEDVLGRPSEPGGDFIFVHNAQAAIRLPRGWLHGGVEYEPRDGELHFADHRSAAV